MGRFGTWSLGLAVSALAHLGLGVALMAALQPQEIPNQPRAKSTLQVTPEEVTRSDASQQTPDSTDITGENGESTMLGAGTVATSTAKTQEVQPPKTKAAQPPSDTATAARLPAVSAAPTSDPSIQQGARALPTDAQQAKAPPANTAHPISPAATSTKPGDISTDQPLRAAAAVAQTTASSRPTSDVSRAAPPQLQLSTAAPLPSTSATSKSDPLIQQTALALPSENQQAKPPPANAAQPRAPQTTRTGPDDISADDPIRATKAATQTTTASRPDPEVSNAEAPQSPLNAAARLPVPAPKRPTPPRSDATVAALPDAPLSTAKQPPLSPMAQQQPSNTILPQATPDVTATKAVLAFPQVGEDAVDPASVAAFQSFTQPETAGTMRDDLQSLLSLPCARMQVSFDPFTTTLEVSGHVPDPSQRAPVVEALQAQMGDDITVTDNLLVLPAPQCGALSGIAAVGLPQSTDQITNPLIVGDDTHARSFRYIKDDPLVLNLTAPDYPAYVYVDYFDADGNVIHLSPNVRAPLTATVPKEQLQIGARTRDEDGLMVIIGPPYGQEIAVAFAASVPLYQHERPLVEPAAPYLAWLREQVAQTRANTPDFKGEWVYFFVQTAKE